MARCYPKRETQQSDAQDSRQSGLCWQGKQCWADHKYRGSQHCDTQVETAEDETERMRAELLQKEKELLALKRKEIDQQIATYKRQMDQVTFLNTVLCHLMLSENTEINIHHPNSYCISVHSSVGEEVGTMMRNDLAFNFLI